MFFMEIPVFDSSDRERVIELTDSAGEMDIQSEDFSLEKDVKVTCTLYRSGELVRVEGRVSAIISMECARCLEPAEMEVEGTFLLVVKRLPLGEVLSESESEAADDEEEFIFVEHTVTSIDITGFVRDAIILELPLRVLCRDDCKGLCVVCGHNLNEGDCGCKTNEKDPRWQMLKGLISKTDKN
jgi:uncharacterized protein